MNYPSPIHSSEIKEDELIDIVSKEFWDSVIYDEPEMPIKFCVYLRERRLLEKQKTGNK